MYENKNGGTGRHILNGYIRPFTRNGFLPFILSFVLALIPLIQILIPAITSAQAPTLRGGGLGRMGRLSLKVFAATLLLLAPSLALYLLTYLLGAMLRVGPVWLLYILTGLMMFLAESALVRHPMSYAALARGYSVREAVDGRFIKRLISAGFGSYIACLACLFPFAILALFMDLLPLWLTYICSAFLTAWILSYLGYVINRCYDKAAPALGLPAGPPPPEVGGIRYARTALSLLLVFAMLGQFTGGLAFNEDEEMATGNIQKYLYTASEYKAALEKFTRNGQLNQHTQLKYNSDTGDFYCTMDPTAPNPQGDLVVAVLGFTADCLPGIGTAKNMVEVAYYKRIADDPTKSAAERAAAKRMQYFKFFAASLSLAGPLGKAASMVTGKGVVPFLIIKAGSAVTDPKLAAIIDATDYTLWTWEMVGNTHKVVKVLDEDVGNAWEPFDPESVIGVPSTKPAVSADTGEQSGNEQQPGTEQQPDGPVSPNGDYAPFWGTYKGTLVCSSNTVEAYGVKGSFENPEVTITLDKDGYMSLSYTFNSTYSYEAYGATMSGTTTLPVSFKSVYLTRTLAGYMGDSSSGGFTATTVSSYAGEGYENGGGEVSQTESYSADFSVMFELRRVNGQIVAIADGYVTQRASGTEDSLYMSFNIIKAG